MKSKKVSSKLSAESDPQERADIAPDQVGEPSPGTRVTPRSVVLFGMPRSDPDDYEDSPLPIPGAFREFLLNSTSTSPSKKK